jgi:alpha-1,3-rhamnosyl/mannosyltransferase
VPRRLRVAVDLRAVVSAPTGIGVYTLEILRALAAGDEFELVGLAHARPEVAEELASFGMAVEIERAPLGVLWQQLLLPRRLARGDLDLFWSPILTLPRRTPIPAVVTLHDLAALHVPETLPAKVRWSLLPFLQPTMDQAARIVVATRRVAGEVARAFPEARHKVRVVAHGVAPAFAPATLGEVTAIRARLGASSGYFLAVGTLEPRKNLDLLLEAWPAVRAEAAGAAAQLLVVGPEGWKDRALARRIERIAPLGVRRIGRLPEAELADLFRGALALVYPSLYEGFGLPVAEALAAGVPAIVARDTSPAEVAGEAGVHCDPEAPEALAGILLRLLEAPAERDELAARARRRGAGFSWPLAAAEHARIFREALSERAG